MSDWINHQAVEWAWHCDKVNSTAERVTLVSYAKHSNERGYSGVSVRTIASTWHQHHETISQARDRLISARLLHETKKRRGQTRQTKVYRLPKIAWGSGLQTDTSQNRKRRESGGKAADKRHPNRREQLITDKENINISLNGDILDSKTAREDGTQKTDQVGREVSSSDHHHHRPARDHPKWPEFVNWCASRPRQFDKHGRPIPNTPTEKGFKTWLGKQAPQWRDKVRVDPAGEEGYALDGKFLTTHEANQLGQKNPELIVLFRKAVRLPDGTIKILTE